jgi:hypothetical protein
MKSLVGLIVVLVLGLVSGMAYLLFRPAEKRTSDWKHLKAVPTTVWTGVKSIGTSVKNLFASKPATETPAAHAA